MDGSRVGTVTTCSPRRSPPPSLGSRLGTHSPAEQPVGRCRIPATSSLITEASQGRLLGVKLRDLLVHLKRRGRRVLLAFHPSETGPFNEPDAVHYRATKQLEGRLQVVVLDHAFFLDEEFRVAVRKRWMNGEKVHPSSIWVGIECEPVTLGSKDSSSTCRTRASERMVSPKTGLSSIGLREPRRRVRL